jgi:hypothetical protein
MERHRGPAAIVAAIVVVVVAVLVVDALVTPRPTRIALYGDSLSMQSAQDFQFLAVESGKTTLLGGYNGLAPCDVLQRLDGDATSWHPDVAVLEFVGDNLTPCMKPYAVGTPAYYAKYQQDITTAVHMLRSHGVTVVLIGGPLVKDPGLSQNVQRLNSMYKSIASSTSGVRYVDAGSSVLENGEFTWTLPCLSSEQQCTGPPGTNVVRSPDGIHFCPSGATSVQGPYDVCPVYSSGAYRFASAMLGAAVDP